MNPNVNSKAARIIAQTLNAANKPLQAQDDPLTAEELTELLAIKPKTKEELLAEMATPALAHAPAWITTKQANPQASSQASPQWHAVSILEWYKQGYELWKTAPDGEHLSTTVVLGQPVNLNTLTKATISRAPYSITCVFHFASGEKETITRSFSKKSMALKIAAEEGWTDRVNEALNPPKPLTRTTLEDI